MDVTETRSNRGAELVGLVTFALALMLLIALATFDPRDPAPFFRAGAEGPARNFIGPFGAFLAEMLVPQLFGLASLLLPITLGLLGWKLFWCRPI
ncbi:MAG TPA: DNA translocase FtsK 4TM domain-containing protein, partial [Vicinamibacteria bacterium]